MEYQKVLAGMLADMPKPAADADPNTLVSTVAYLIGVPRKFFDQEFASPEENYFNKLDKQSCARIIRHLCILRTKLMRNFSRINRAMKEEMKSILSLPDLVPSESIQVLTEENVTFLAPRGAKLSDQEIEINRLITDRINNCRELFPVWIKWDYIRDLFVMPDGLKESRVKEEAENYQRHTMQHPYQMYVNWDFSISEGNILLNDKKFATLLYEQHMDEFIDMSLVSDTRNDVKENIYQFLNHAQTVILLVDCENSDPYKLTSTINGLDDVYFNKISSIILFDDVHTSPAWDLLGNYTGVPVEHLEVERVKDDKSLVDAKLIARAAMEHYANHVDSFILVSSDSDYWGMISSMTTAHFLVMVEHDSCGPDLKRAMEKANIFYCYIDDFYSGDSQELKRISLLREMNQSLKENFSLNLWELLNQAARTTRMELPTTEREAFYKRYVTKLQLQILDNGDVQLFKMK